MKALLKGDKKVAFLEILDFILGIIRMIFGLSTPAETPSEDDAVA